MARSQFRSTRKASGGRYHRSRSKKQHELVGPVTSTKIGEGKRRAERTLGGNTKQSILSENKISVSDKKGKVTVTTVENVVENAANPHLVRRNILTKGAVVETKLGKVRVTSRPGQQGSLQGVLV